MFQDRRVNVGSFIFLILQDRLKGIFKLVKQIQEEKNKNEPNLMAVIKAHDKLQAENKVSPYHKVTNLREVQVILHLHPSFCKCDNKV